VRVVALALVSQLPNDVASLLPNKGSAP